jgi:hypothetical protein
MLFCVKLTIEIKQHLNQEKDKTLGTVAVGFGLVWFGYCFTPTDTEAY